MYNRTTSIICVALLVLSLASVSEAALFGRDLDGNLTTAEAYYDDHLMITWLADANFCATNWLDFSCQIASANGDGGMQADESLIWIDNLDFGGFTDWRLPTTMQPDATCAAQTGTQPPQGFGTGCTGSEMGHMYYAELGNVAGGPLTNTGPFSNLEARKYWSETPLSFAPNHTWWFDFSTGIQAAVDSPNLTNVLGWAVHSGDIGAPVPVPSSILLFGTGLAAFIGWNYRRTMRS